jgi:outer membrane protein OmpA-like peptidoglycan-associated protein
VVLAADPEGAGVGQLTVRAGGGEVQLVDAGTSTTVSPGGTPTPAAPISDVEVQRLFGPALAIQPPAARRFSLYFELGGDTLTAESRTQVPEVLATVQARVAPEVSVVGHTDTSGAAAANVTLGLRRAELIRTLLVTAGLDPALVEVRSHGETDLLVATPDNTTEARNRRVEVVVR